MATLILQSVGAAFGGALGGPLGAMIGRAAGALGGRMIDERLFSRDQVVRGPRLEQAQIMASTDGAGMPRVYGRARIGGQIVWATRFEEAVSRSSQGGGKGGGPTVTVEEYRYFANFAVGICEGPVTAIRRLWADGVELDQTRYEIRYYLGGEVQLADPLIEAKQGLGKASALRGTAYAVFDRFPLEEFGNRIPQLSFEVMRSVSRLDRQIKSIVVIPGSTEFGYSPEPVSPVSGTSGGAIPMSVIENRNCLTHESDWQASISELTALCPALETVALVVTWFGDDLRAGNCLIKPGVEHTGTGGPDWGVNGVSRQNARLVSQIDGRPAFGGTPRDQSVIDAIRDLKARGLRVVLYPFVMMDIPAGNSLPDPNGSASQQAYPWRGRITCDPGLGEPVSADKTAFARAQVLAFAGAATPGDFSVNGDAVTWTGGADWGYRRLILHYAKLAGAAGGVDGFLIGSEMRGLTMLRDDNGAFPFVGVLQSLAGDVRSVLGAGSKITYAADWSEYFGYHPADGSNDVLFHLDPLWADPAIDAVGIDNYMPLADWRPGGDPQATGVHSQTDPAYLLANVAAGEGQDWYYASAADRSDGVRTPITDGLGEPWIWRFKDIKSWWSNPHHERVAGVRSPTPTAWAPQSKPVWFTEIGCPAVSMGANQPNVFPDPKSSDSALPYFSTGARSDLTQNRFLGAHFDYWNPDTASLPESRNPVSPVYGARMVDTANIFPWAWDARPFPQFPANGQIWADGANWHTGHWLNGRLGGCPANDLLKSLAADFGIAIERADTDGFADGYVVPGPMPAREAIGPLAAFFNAGYVEEGGDRRFVGKPYASKAELEIPELAGELGQPVIVRSRDHEGELPRQIEISHAEILSGFEPVRSLSRRIETASRRAVSMDLPIVLPGSSAAGVAEARLRDAWIGRETLRIGLPRRYLALSVGDHVAFSDPGVAGGIPGLWRIESIEDDESRHLRLRAISQFDENAAQGSAGIPDHGTPAGFGAPAFSVMNLPLGPEEPEPRIYCALAASPWARRYGIWSSPDSFGFSLRRIASRQAVTGELLAAALPGPEGRWDMAGVLRVKLLSGELAAIPDILALNGGNAAAIRSASGEWEILQFAEAVLMPDASWRLTRLLRGQMGTEVAMTGGAPAGSPFVLLDDRLQRVPLLALESGLTLNWRAGPANDPVSASTYTEVVHAHAPLTLRPFSPVHLKAARIAGGDIQLNWMRRSRIDADSWDAPDVPLGEAVESYRIEIIRPNGDIARSFESATPSAIYPVLAQIADFGLQPSSVSFAVTQLGAGGVAGASRTATGTL